MKKESYDRVMSRLLNQTHFYYQHGSKMESANNRYFAMGLREAIKIVMDEYQKEVDQCKN